MISGSRVHKTHLTMKLAFVTAELYPEHKVGWRNVSEGFLLLHGEKLCRKLPLAVFITLTSDD